jgi:hypothetical protein
MDLEHPLIHICECSVYAEIFLLITACSRLLSAGCFRFRVPLCSEYDGNASFHNASLRHDYPAEQLPCFVRHVREKNYCNHMAGSVGMVHVTAQSTDKSVRMKNISF